MDGSRIIMGGKQMLSVVLRTIEKRILEAKSTEQDFIVMTMEEAEIIVAILKNALNGTNQYL